MLLERTTVAQKGVTVTNSLATCQEIPFENASAGQVYVPSGSSLTVLTWYSKMESDGTFVAVQDGAGNAVTSTVSASMCCLIPAACFGCKCLKAVGNTTGYIDISVKS
jgi:hypothetical protein